MNYKELKKQLKEKIDLLYLFFGEELFLRDYMTEMLKERVVDKDFADFNFLKLNSENLTVENVTEFFEAYPVMTDRKLLIIRDGGLFAGKGQDKDAWVKIFSDIPDYMTVLITEDSADKRSKLYKAIEKIGTVCEFSYLERPDIKSHITKKLAAQKKDMGQKELELFMDMCGPDLTGIRLQLDKLIAYCNDRDRITESDIKKVIVPPLMNRVYDISEAVISKNGEYALRLLSDLKKSGESGVRILAIISGYFADLYKAIVLSKENMAYGDMLAAMKLPPSRRFVADKLFRRARSVNADFIRSCLSECVKAESDIKNGISADWSRLELLICEIILIKN